MKVYSLAVVDNRGPKAKLLSSEYDLSSFSFFERGTYREFMAATDIIVAERTQAGQRQTIEEQGYNFHIYARAEGLAGIVIADKEYPTRVAFTLLNKILDEFIVKYPRSQWNNPAAINYPELKDYITKYQDPRQADNIMRVQQELDETKIILHKTINSVLERGEKLDDLIERSEGLSTQSKMFYKQAKRTNSCCVIS